MIITMMDGKHQEWLWIVVVTDSKDNDTNASGGSAWYP